MLLVPKPHFETELFQAWILTEEQFKILDKQLNFFMPLMYEDMVFGLLGVKTNKQEKDKKLLLSYPSKRQVNNKALKGYATCLLIQARFKGTTQKNLHFLLKTLHQHRKHLTKTIQSLAVTQTTLDTQTA